MFCGATICLVSLVMKPTTATWYLPARTIRHGMTQSGRLPVVESKMLAATQG